MIFVLKLVITMILVSLCDIALISILGNIGVLSTASAIIVSVLCVVIFSFILYSQVIKPLSSLYDALRIIDFDKDVIDFSKLDALQVSGCKEIKFIITKFKYLLDIIAERINRVNSETYKSEHDELTKCFNRVRLENYKGMYELSNTIAILFIDVNNLKRMNDEFGHEAGDALLRSAANHLNFWNNHGDVYRMGGDEFMVVVKNQTPEAMNKLVNMWYPTVGQLNRDTDGFKCVLSYGLAFGTKGCNFDSLQKQADDKMYEMKVALKKKFGEPLR